MGREAYFLGRAVSNQKNEKEHDEILKEVISRAKKFSIKFNRSKVQFKVSEVAYLGQIFSAEGVRPDPDYVKAILELEDPTNKKELLRILGKFMFIADILSRSFIKSNVKDDPEMEEIVHSLELDFPISKERLLELRNASSKNLVLSKIIDFCGDGWPEDNKSITNPDIKAFFNLKDNLYVHQGLIFHDYRLVPQTLRHKMLSKLHVGHFGIEKSKARARKLFYWPGLSRDVQDFVSKCKTCLKYSKSVVKEPLMQHERPNEPFLEVAADILT
ncbi:uncharacterized protein K02A2.6-like [Diorhabda carinulata]|uniref:uncharacterized protein K02A2.6-like n=1 Tax=Diorhabda carinulata TaxID=1163345 RepID=UPI0025A1EBE3|nr:uncharacterized protein K02A2.6-like [Diorhabda carinulata]